MPLADQLEALVDQYGLSQVLTALSEVCHAKEEHLACNWQDTASARVWRSDAVTLENAANKVRAS